MGMRALVTGRFTGTARGGRIDWQAVRDTINLADVATRLLGPAPGRRGERSTRRLWWICPLHDDGNPSLCVKVGDKHWRCCGCGAKGDAIDLVRRLNPGWTFPEAVAYATGQPVPSGGHSKPSNPPAAGPARPSMPSGLPVRAAEHPPDGPTGLPPADALALVDEAAARLWEPEGRAALACLEGRGLTSETIKAARLGWAEKIRMPKRDGGGTWPLTGIVLPWLESGRLTRIKVRRLGLFTGAKYIEAFASGWRIYPGPEAIRAGAPLIIAEGEFDRLLLAQELGDLASVVTLGSASSRPDGATLLAMLRCPTWFIALDGDDTGDRAAAEWPARAERARPPAPDKDWTEAHQSGVDLRRWWSDRLGGIEAPERSTWDELVARHGPGIVIDRPARPTIAPSAAGPADEYERQERAGIMEFDGGLTREAAEHATGLRPSD